MSCIARPAALCVVCKCSLDVHAPHAIINHDYAHLDCADWFDSRDLRPDGNPDWRVNLPGLCRRQAE